MEVGQDGDRVAIVTEGAASLGGDGIEIIDGLQMSVGERFVDERTGMLGRPRCKRAGRRVFIAMMAKGQLTLADQRPDAAVSNQCAEESQAC